MKYLGLLLVLFSVSAHAANKEHAQEITQELQKWVTPSQSATPDKALLYRSNANNVDDTSVSTGISLNVANGVVEITRGETLSLTKCSADYGPVTIEPTKLKVATTHLPVRVLCSTQDGGLRAFYTTYKQP